MTASESENLLRCEGRCAGPIPFGFDLGAHNALLPNRAQLQVVVEIQRRRADGEGLKSISDRLIKREVPTKTGASFSPGAVRYILGNGIYRYAEAFMHNRLRVVRLTSLSEG